MNMNDELQHHFERGRAAGMSSEQAEIHAANQFKAGVKIVINEGQTQLQRHHAVAVAMGSSDAAARQYALDQVKAGEKIVFNEEKLGQTQALDQTQGLEPLDIDWVQNSVFAEKGKIQPVENSAGDDGLVPTDIDWRANSVFAPKL